MIKEEKIRFEPKILRDKITPFCSHFYIIYVGVEEEGLEVPVIITSGGGCNPFPRLKQSQIKQETEKSKIKLITQKKLIKVSITKFKKDIRNFQKKMEYLHKNCCQPSMNRMINWGLN